MGVVLEADEVAALLAARGLDADDSVVRELLRRTAGRPADVVLAVRRMAERAGSAPAGDLPLAADALAGLPLLSAGLVDELLGPGAWRRLTASAAHLHARSDGWYVATSAPDRGSDGGRGSTVRRDIAARWYAGHGQLATAVRWLHACDDVETLTAVLAETLTSPDRARRWAELDELEPGELEAVVQSWPDDVVQRRPEALLALTRAVEFGMQAQLRAEWLARLDRLVGPHHESWVAVEAELVRELARQGKADEVHSRAAGVAQRADEVSRARLLMAEALVDLMQHERSAEEPARTMLQEAAALLRVNGEREWEADAWLSLGVGADLVAGQVGLAVEHMERALALSTPGSQLRGRVLSFLVETLTIAGRGDEAEAALRELDELAASRQDVVLTAYTAWSGALVAARRGDLTRTKDRLQVVEAHRGEWYQLPAGVVFHAEAAEMLATLGEYAGARAHLRVGREHPAAPDHPTAFDLADLVLAARSGDPDEVEDLASRCARTPVTSWRITLLRAWAAQRAGEAGTARALADQALAEAESLGHPEIVEAVEPELALWARGPAAKARSREPGRLVRLLGTVDVEGAASGHREPRPGDETTLLVAVAARHDVHLRDLLDLLWPGEDEAVARRRLRNTLNRLRGSVGEVVARRGDRLGLAPDVHVDVHLVILAARTRHTVPELRVEAARRALMLVRGGGLAVVERDPVLDDLRYELSLAVGVLADRVSDAATTAGELGEAARWLAQARRLDRYDEPRAVRLVHVLRALGREAEADAVLRDAVLASAELGVFPSAELTMLAGD